MIKIPFINKDEFSISLYIKYIYYVCLTAFTVNVMVNRYLLTYQHNSCFSCKQHLEILDIAVVNL